MKALLLPVVPVLILLATGMSVGHAATRPDIDPCDLIALEKVYAAYPALKKMEKQTIDTSTTCNYLDKFGIPALIISIHKNDGISSYTMMTSLGVSYSVRDVPGLGDEAAMAISVGNPKYNIPGGEVAELYIKKGGNALLLAPARIKVKADGSSFEKFKNMSMKMLEKL